MLEEEKKKKKQKKNEMKKSVSYSSLYTFRSKIDLEGNSVLKLKSFIVGCHW